MLSIRVTAPATIANLGPGFDLIGMALDKPRDIVEVFLEEKGEDEVKVSGLQASDIPLDPNKNSAMVAAKAVLKKVKKENFKIKMNLIKEIPPRRGLGSSGASSIAGAYAVNCILGNPLKSEELLECAMEGEKVACGSPHIDNIAPALFGGITFISSFNPIRIIRLEPIKNAEILVLSPKIEIGIEKTKIAREILPKEVMLKTMVNQIQSFGNLIIGLMKKDLNLIGLGISGDHVIEPARAKLIPRFYDLKNRALENGAYGFSISGAGPSVFALVPKGEGKRIGEILYSILRENGILSEYSIHENSEDGVKIVS
ncbi:MAG: homoserine kinase [Candidatus Methanomethylicota archaeon]|jgi:homoserine kinase|uniref:Homoserine kinase n=1 Tax=Thermoproteota archaeon TaxID=2056631 RepID=A0A523BHN5_9CREN|nr:MAG: homoserine kinase [Candidatus Verstraetearchaeota archaeon]TDA40437.1 MAG: homoserine kinase [Candidatus Verstraetearchaeota archaeon]